MSGRARLHVTAFGVLSTLLWVLASLKAAWPAVTAVNATEATRNTQQLQDFRDAAYFPVREFASGGDPYVPQAMLKHWPVRQQFDLYLPAHLLLNYPLDWLTYHQGAVLYTVVGLALLTVLGAASAAWADLPGGRNTQIFVAALFVGSQTGSAQIYLGQLNSLVALGVAAALVYSGSRSAPAALGVAIAWLKPQFGIPLVILLTARGRIREAISGTLLAAAVSLPVVVVLVFRAGSLSGFLDVIRENLSYAQDTSYDAANSQGSLRIDAAADLYRITGWLPSSAGSVLAAGALALGSFLLYRRRCCTTLSDGDQLTVALIILLAVVHQPGDSLIVLPAVVSVAGRLIRQGPVDPLLALSAIFAVVPALHYSVVSRIAVAVLGGRFDSLIDGVALLIAMALSVAWSLRTPARRLDLATESSR